MLAAPALLETYAVLTRLPAPYRLSPHDCCTLLEANFPAASVKVVALPVDGYRRLIHDAPAAQVSGGQIYDAAIVACARAGGVGTLLTFNDRHFAPFAAEDLHVVVPS